MFVDIHPRSSRYMMCKIFFICFLALVCSTDAQAYCKNGARCIPIVQCPGLYNQLKNVEPALVSILRRLHCGFDRNSEPMLCCPPEFLTVASSNRLGGLDKEAALALLPDLNVCGIQNTDRIIGGTQTELDEHPWMALIGYQKPKGFGYYCGGVLISSRYVLTAAHCVKGADLPPSWRLSQVRLGEWNTSSARDCARGDCSPPTLDVTVEEAIAHEDYRPTDGHQQNDIALLRLSQDVPFNDFVKPICLPLSAELRRNTFETYDMEVAGWGKTETRSASEVKLKVRVPVIKKTDCVKIYQQALRTITDNQLCAGGLAGQDSCRGDSGGALMGTMPQQQNWMAVGVVSYGPSPCGTPGWPGVYSRVTAYIDWILSNLRQ